MKHGSNHFTPESNWLSAEWKVAGESRSKWPKMQTSTGKVLAYIFWNVQIILFIDYLEKGRTINNKYYIALMVYLKEEMAKKWPQMTKKKMLFYQDNALCHKSIAMMAKVHELCYELLPHPPYSPDLAPSIYIYIYIYIYLWYNLVSYLPTPLLGQDMTHGQFLSRV